MSSRSVISRHCRLSVPSNPILARSRLSQPKLPPTEHLSQRRCLAAGRAVPKILEPSMWTSMIPKFLRRGNRRGAETTPRKSRAPNTATFYAIIFTLIGSQAIRMIMLRNEYANETRSADAKIRLLKEVIERIQKGEDVDVKRLLVLKEIEQEESLWHSRAKRTHRGNVPKPDSDRENDSQQSTTPQQSEPDVTTKYQRATSNEGPTTETSKPQRPSSFF
ncbi:hypothetical protein EMPG_16954 [Blastomyces silverae]|uniref:Uncharacterized protein n=1 Tax=Blastomyces silverae TaxID=2060906 RepID=A0A0H1B7Y8_9EURO|nr:hypothetical protein EMPG_16954 [Blastomyces silverae]